MNLRRRVGCYLIFPAAALLVVLVMTLVLDLLQKASAAIGCFPVLVLVVVSVAFTVGMLLQFEWDDD